MNGATPGSGNAGGTWSVGGGNWSTDPAGETEGATFANGDSVVFSAGSDGIGAFAIELEGTISTPSILFDDLGLVNLNGGALDVTGGLAINTSVLGPVGARGLDWTTALVGEGSVTVAGHGDTSNTGGGSNTIFTFSGENSFSGDFVITSGVVGYLSNFGAEGNGIVLDGGGLVFNSTGIFARDITAGENGGVLRNYGAATTTHTGVLSGAGDFRRTDGGVFVVTEPSGHTGSWRIERGTVESGATPQTSNLLASSAGFFLGDDTGAGTLRLRHEGDFEFTQSIEFGASGGTLAFAMADPADRATVASSAGFDDFNIGKLRIENGELVVREGDAIAVNEIGVTSPNAPDAALRIEGGTLSLHYLNVGDGNNSAGGVFQTGGEVKFEAGGPGLRLGHWTNGPNPGSVYNLSGGVLDATALDGNAGEARFVSVGWDGRGTMSVGGGEGPALLKAAGVRLDRNRAGDANFASTFTLLPNGTVELGAAGTEGQGTNDAFILAGGTLRATTTSNWNSRFVAQDGTSSTLDVNGFFPRMAGNISGGGTIQLIDSLGSGLLELDSGAGTRVLSADFAGDVMISKFGLGTLRIESDLSQTGEFLVSEGSLDLAGSVSSSLLDINDGATLAGTGTVDGDLALGFFSGGTLRFDPQAGDTIHVTGSVELNGLNFIQPSAPFGGTVTVLTYDGTLSGGAANITLAGDIDSYRSASVNLGTPGEISVTIDNESLVWTGAGGGLWDLDTTGGWNNSSEAADNFFFGDDVRFDDSAGAENAAVTIAGTLQPGFVVVDNSEIDYSWTSDFDGSLAGAGSLIKRGTGTLSITGANTFSGGTTISSGTVQLRSNGALGSGSVTLGDDDTGDADIAIYLDQERVNFTNPIIVSSNAGGTVTLGSRSTVGGAADNNQFTNIRLERDVIFDSNANDRTDYENISGTGNIRIVGTGRSILPTTPANWVGDLTVATTGTTGAVQIGVASAAGNRIPDASNVTVEAGALLRLSTTGETIAGLFGAGTINTNAPAGGTATLTVGFGGADGEFSGLLTNGPNVLALSKTGAGTQVLSGNNDYTGITNVIGGTLRVGNGAASGSLGQGGVNVGAGATLEYDRSGTIVQVGGLNSAGAVGQSTFTVNGDETTLLILNAGGAFNGVLNLNQGTLVLGATNPTAQGANAATYNLAAGTTLTTGPASNHAHLGNVNLAGGSRISTASTGGSYNGENYQLNGNVTVSGGDQPAIITRAAERTNANSGLAIGIGNGPRTFDVADLTGSPAPDLIVTTELENPDNGVGALVKTGAGTMQLGAAIDHSFSGLSTIEQGVLLASGSIVGPVAVTADGTLAPDGSFAAGATTLGGTLSLRVSGAEADRLDVNGDLDLEGGTLSVSASGATAASYVLATWTGTRSGSFASVSGLPAGYTLSYNDGSGQLLMISGEPGDPYGEWELANGILGSGPGTDSDNDGVPNGIEFVIGGDPAGGNSNPLLPTASREANGDLVFVFRRTAASAGFAPFVQYGSDLVGWTAAANGSDGVTVNVESNGFEPGVDRVTVTIPAALAGEDDTIFARLAVEIP